MTPAAGEPLRLGRHGIRAWQLSDAGPAEAADAAAELEDLGFGAVWIRARGFFERAAELLDATEHLVVASSVISIWSEAPAEVAAAAVALQTRHPGRLLVGIGVSHRPLVDRGDPGRFRRPLATMRDYLDELDAGGLSSRARIIAALGPKMLGVAGERSTGTHPYLVTPAHSRRARATLGPGRLVAPAHVAVLEIDRARALELGRRHLANPYLELPNYRNTLLGLGFDDGDLADGGSERLVDALVASGDAETVAATVSRHLDAGADHVSVHLITEPGGGIPREEWRQLAHALTVQG
jgi:probable F420-dependent oxidoreductase